jgi:CheY-like chemotaxis protein/HPt (histidine-containing phosphotransfer) domain-containing protein
MRSRPGGGGIAHLLVVEDNPVNQRLAAAMLERRGFVVDVVGDGRTAVEIASAGGYEAVLMDCQLPVMDGYEAAAAIRQHEAALGDGSHIPILAMTASTMQGDAERCAAAGMDAFIAKPVDWDEAVQQVMRYVRTRTASTRQVAHVVVAPVSAGLDPDVIAELRDLARLGPERVDQLIDTFHTTSTDKLAEASSALMTGDHLAISKAGHALAGSAGSMGAAGLAVIARDLELAGRLEDSAAAAGAIERLRDQLDDAIAALRHELSVVEQPS